MIKARCHPALFDILPKPQPAALPYWVRDMPPEVSAPSLGGAAVRTLKHCPPVLDAMSCGITLHLVCDLEIRAGEVHWDWDPPIVEDADLVRAPIGLHVPEQAKGAPFAQDGLILKFINFWTLSVPEGFSILFTHPLNQPDLPFETLSGLVDCDQFSNGYVHFPALWRDTGFEGRLPKGTPIAQAFAVPRAAQTVDVAAMEPEDVEANRRLQARLAATRGVYRKDHRH